MNITNRTDRRCRGAGIACVAALAVALAGPADAAVWNVNADGTGDAPTIQAAFDAAVSGDMIVLAPGIYTDAHTRTIQGHSQQQTTTAVAFMKNGVGITGSGGAAVTFIDGEGTHHGLFGVDVGLVTVSGITFTRCTRSGGEIWGGGLMFHRSAPVVEHCVFEDCHAWAAGGVFLSQGQNGVVRFCKFLHNTGGDLAGAVEIYQHQGALIENNTFVGNSTSRYGGALMLNDSDVEVRNNIFYQNSSILSGGAIGCLGPPGYVVTGGCNVFWLNSAPETFDSPVAVGVNDNISADPLFCSPASGDFTLQATSPAAPGDPSGCGLRGACPVACGPVAIETQSWGATKAAYR